MSGAKKFGLIMPERSKLSQPVFQASRNVFGEDSESDDESSKKRMLTRPSNLTSRQAIVTKEKAIMEDPTVYQYDEIYESLSQKPEKQKSQEVKKPKYIENLIKSANKRKIENERRVERQIQKEREKEGDEFADKEVFVTSAYKKKLEEMRLEEEKEKREQYLESIGDVTKQQDLGGFYRHLYEQRLGKEVSSDKNDKSTPPPKDNAEDEKEPQNKSQTIKRNYRKRKQSEGADHLSEGEIILSDEETNRLSLKDIREAKKLKQNENIDADSDFNDSSEDEENQESRSNIHQSSNKGTSALPTSVTTDETSDMKATDKTEVVEETPEDKVTEEQVKPKIDIWKKRTVGEVFQQALQRYYERKSARGS